MNDTSAPNFARRRRAMHKKISHGSSTLEAEHKNGSQLKEPLEHQRTEVLCEFSSFVELLRHRCETQETKVAFRFIVDDDHQEESLTYGQLDKRARAIAATLQHYTTKGDRAILLYAPGLAFMEAFYGCLYAGVIAVPVYPPNLVRPERTLPRFLSIVGDACPSVILTDSTIEPMISEVVNQHALQQVTCVATDRIIDEEAEGWLDLQVGPETLACLQYTSGSTAFPKGVMLTHGNFVANTRLIKHAFEDTSESVYLSWLPLYHDMGLLHVLHPIFLGATCLFMDPICFLQRPFRWLQAISQYKVSNSGAPNFAYDLCVSRISQDKLTTLNLSHWRIAFNGSEPVRAETLERFAETFSPCGFRREALYPCYGLAEGSLIVSGGVASAPPRIVEFDSNKLEQNRAELSSSDACVRLVGCGGSLLEQEIAVVDRATHMKLPFGEIGEIWVKGRSVARGYWNRREESEQTFEAHLHDGTGPFLRTGDLGFFSYDELFVTGRLKDLIILGGRNHYPQDLELTVEKCHPLIRAGGSAAFSVDVGGKERLVVVAEIERKAFYARQQFESINDCSNAIKDRASVIDSIKQAVRSSLSMHHGVACHDIVLLRPGHIPKTSSGKIKRYMCRAGFLDNTISGTL